MQKSINKLGLTQDERAVTYLDNSGKTRVGEIRQFDPIDGHIVVYQGFDEPNIEVPLTKTVDTDSSAKAVTVSRFPS